MVNDYSITVEFPYKWTPRKTSNFKAYVLYCVLNLESLLREVSLYMWWNSGHS